MKSTDVRRSFRDLLVSLVAIFILAGCANIAIREAREQFDAGRSEEGLEILYKATLESPDNPALRSEYLRQREFAVAQWLAHADSLRGSGQNDLAAVIYGRVQKYDPQNTRAREGLSKIAFESRYGVVIANVEKLIKEGKFVEARNALRPVLDESPTHRDVRRLKREIDEKTLKPAVVAPQIKFTSKQPITLELRDVPLGFVFEVITRATGLSFFFDKDIRRDQLTSLAVRNTMPEELIRLVLATNQLQQKIINETTILVFPNTPQKRDEYQELVIRTFYLTNAEAKQTATMLRTVIKTRDIFVDEKRNMIVIKDTPDAIRMAERLVAAQDLADPEVVLEVEVMQVNNTRLLELGVRWPEQVLFQDPSTVPQPGLPGTVTAATSLQRASGGLTAFVATPALLLRLNQEVGATKLLANPRIRVKNREKARIQIGDRVPVITTTLVTGGFSTESVSYLDVGLLLEVEPTISLDDEVSMKVGLEVSNIVREIRTESGSLVYQIGTRNASTLLRLGNGETQVLAGLISDEERQAASGLPGLTDLPILSRLFSVTTDQTERTEIVLLITPHLVRTLARPDNRVIEFSAGTQGPAGQVRTAPTPRQQSPVAKPPTSKPAEKPAAPPTTFRPGMQPPSR